jgi:hypothetical protein
MGTRTNALVDHRIPDFWNQEAVIESLKASLPDCLAVCDYWSSIEPDDSNSTQLWAARFHHNPPEQDFVWYHGPGGFLIRFGSRVAVVSALCRWRGFLSVEALQVVHSNAFRKIALSLGGSRMLLIPDDEVVEPMAIDHGASLSDCRSELRERCGPPRRRSVLADNDAALEPPACWKVWHDESLYDSLPDTGHQIAEHTLR